MAIVAAFVNATTFTATVDAEGNTDLRDQCAIDVWIKADCGADGYKYGVVSAVSYSAPTTTIQITGDALTSNLIRFWHGNDNPASLVNHASLHAVGGRDALSPAAIGALGLNVSSEVAITAAATLADSAFGKMHVVNLAADGTIGLPAAAGNAGKLLGIRIGNACTKLVTLDANASELIDGALTRVMWAGESAILLCDGAGWTKIAGKTIPMACKLSATATQSIPASTLSVLRMDSVISDIGSISDIANNKIVIKRSGLYFCYAAVSMSATISYQILLNIAGSYTRMSVGASGYGVAAFNLAQLVGGNVVLAQINAASTADATYNQPYPALWAVEAPTW